jgi:WXXGXW repeat (2 copies)
MRKLISVRSLMIHCLPLLAVVLAFSAASAGQIGVGISVSFGPPALPVYEQPICPGDGYMWTPGYWAWDPDFDDYYWVPGTWVLAPEVGFLWTPPWWGWGGAAFIFHEGFWGPTIGFYGGIDYGFGYFGTGFLGGRWDNGHFFYNRAVMNVNVTNIHNVYNMTFEDRNVNHVSYNGGAGGIDMRPTPEQEAAERGQHIGPVAAQTEHINAARGNPELRASRNQGRPPIAATARPGEFTGGGVVAAREAGAPYHPPANRGGPAAAPVHAKDLGPAERLPAPNTGDAKLDKKYQKQQDKLAAQQEKERQKLQKQQDQEHQRAANQQANEQRTQQMEQRHQQQTQQLQQRQSAQRQQLQQRQAAPRGGGEERR